MHQAIDEKCFKAAQSMLQPFFLLAGLAGPEGVGAGAREAFTCRT
jgi:hypothetical protein